MNDGGIYEADAAIDAEVQPHGFGRNGRATHTGEDSLTAAVGGIRANTSKRPASSERELSPLLQDQSSNGDRGGKDTLWEQDEEFRSRPWWKRPSVSLRSNIIEHEQLIGSKKIYWMLVPFSMNALAFGGIIVPRMNLFLDLICREVLADESISYTTSIFKNSVMSEDDGMCRQNGEVQSQVALFTLYGNLISGILSALISPKLGALSDRYGRKKIIIITSAGLLANEALCLAAASNMETFNINWLLMGFALDGVCGSFIAAMSLAHAYATDCTPPSQRSVAFALYHGCLFTGIAVGPILAGLMIKATETVTIVFWIAVSVHLFFAFFVILIVPESLSKARQYAAREKYQLSLSHSGPRFALLRTANLFEPLKILWPTGPGTTLAVRSNLVLLAAIDTIMFGVAMGSMSVVTYYTEYQFGWGNYEASRFISIVNSSRVISLLVVLPIITRIFRGAGKSTTQKNTGSDNFELNTIRIAVLFDTLGYLGYTLVRKPELMILSGAVTAIGAIGSPTLQAALTKHVPRDKTGQLLGASGLLHALARVVAPTVFNAIYSKTVKRFTQTVFVCLTATFGVAFLLTWFVRPHVYVEESGVVAEGGVGERREDEDADEETALIR
ncbi:MAG: hypothetical protein M1820_001705 [Bogoriella megaspora]|nr:MAG: hypothetical protein M1820_001705 [Bogoriella megaspora]